MSPLLQVEGLIKHFPGARRGMRGRGEPVVAVDGVSFTVERGSTVAIVGESGSGKSTTGRMVLRLIEPTAGSITFNGVDLLGLGDADMRKMRSRMQIIFQDTYASLDPRWTIGRLLAEPLAWHTDMTKKAIRDRVDEVLGLVGLETDSTDRFPHEFSGGQRQRIGIARALLLGPDLVVCDEPVSALDMSIQAQVLDLMKDLQDQLGLSYIFISHDLSVVRMVADHVLVMRRGVVVESAPTEQIFTDPQHAYTKGLLAAIPVPDPAAHADRAEKRRLVREGLAAGVSR